MKKAIAVVFLLTNIIIFGACFFPCFCQEETQVAQPQLFRGKIAAVDLVGSKITVKYLQPNGDNDEITLAVNSHTKVDKGNQRIPLAHIKEGDEVIVEYYDDPMTFDPPKVTQISVKSLF